ncbi:hypothetical protein [Caulobacter sp. NIBR1757]|uniref:hypothetical protein n=1 Tax=Caulobacter sp. NIBR1757 TaxID=3016000 RepID=UPI0022F0A0F3|nr:hypothetical protein [Caulobacter sp. NIBR1757]WGM37640.1 hypothetical protein AMEJIAPC_00539 [Caulobacter sp. NIBR1757]
MSGLKKFLSVMAAASASLVLASCGGADGVASPGEGDFGGGGGGTGGGGGGGGTGGAAADCPTGFANVGTVNAAVGGTLRICQLPALITGNLVVPLRTGTIYSVSGRVDVGQDRGGNAASPIAGATQGILTVEPGVRIFGSAGLDYIVVNRGSQIFAQGTSTAPIVFTSRQSVEGTTGVDSIGQWGGLVILGRANISNCPALVAYGSPNCEAQVEGTNALYGGSNNSDNSGVLQYVRVMHSGFQILPGNELNGITLAGVGSGTTVDHVQVHNSSDDGIEWFGGNVNAKYLVLTGNDDDSLDTDQGFSGALQYVLVVQRTNGGDRVIESSMASLATGNPRTSVKLSNFTFVARDSGSDAIVLNTGTDYNLYNGVVTRAGTTGACLDVDDAATTATFRSVFFSCTTSFRLDGNQEANTSGFFGSGTNNNLAGGTSTLTGTFINGANENGVTVTNPTPLSAFLATPANIGAVRNSTDTWYSGWTCGLPGATAC